MTPVANAIRRLTVWMMKGTLHHPIGQRGARRQEAFPPAATPGSPADGLAALVNAWVAANHCQTREGAMDVMLWILIGLAAGLAIAAVAPEMGPRSLSQSGSRGVRDMAAGMIGAVAVAYAFTRFSPALRVDGLTTAFAALAGALWIAGVVEVYSSRRRAGEDTEQRQPERSGTPSAIELPAYDAARQALVAGLIEDALAHDAGRYAEIGRELPAVRAHRYPAKIPASRLQVALRFWRGWTEARDEQWRGDEADKLIAVADWPRFARTIASDLALDRDTREPAIVTRFG